MGKLIIIIIIIIKTGIWSAADLFGSVADFLEEEDSDCVGSGPKLVGGGLLWSAEDISLRERTYLCGY